MADYPTTEYSSQGLVSNIDESQHVSESGKVQTRRHGGQRFSMTIEHPPQTKADFMPVYAFLRSQQGREQSFTISLPDKLTPLGAVSGSPVVNGTYARGATSIAIDGLVAGTADVFYAGDMFNFGNHAKGYKIVSTVNAGADVTIDDETGVAIDDETSVDILAESSGQADVTIFPPLVEDVADATAINYGANFTLTVKQVNDVQKYMVEPPNIYAFGVELVEYIA